MATSFRMFVFATFILSCIACVLLVVAIATPNWIVAEAKVSSGISNNNLINYGLFGGENKNMAWSTPRVSNLYISCLVDETVCMYSCLGTAEAREAETRRLLKKDYTYEVCPSSVRSLVAKRATSPLTDKSSPELRADTSPTFISFIVWICVLILLGLSILMGIVSGFFSVLNTATNPAQPILAIFGLYIWNGIGAVSCLAVLLTWGIYYSIVISIDIAIFETMTKRSSSEGLAFLGYSYWMVVATFLVFCANIGILLLRQWKINRIPEVEKVPQENVRDGILYLY